MRDLIDGPFYMRHHAYKQMADSILKSGSPLPDEVYLSDLTTWKLEDLEGRRDNYLWRAIGESNPGARAFFLHK